MNIILFIHLIAIGIWAGCVATEAVLEVVLEKVPPLQSGLAVIHAKIDRFVEIPAIIVAVATGGSMLHHATWDKLLVVKVALGASAVVLNSIAAFTVHRRLQCLNAKDMTGYATFNRWHERIGIGCVLSIVGAIVVGGYRLAA
jgi:putative copper export protein